MRIAFAFPVVSCFALSALACEPSVPAASPAEPPAASPTEPPPAVPDIEKSRWSLAQWEMDGHSTLVRVRQDLAPIAGDSAYPNRVEIAADFIHPLKDGMPEPDDARALDPIEDAIVAQFDTQHDGLLAAVITGNGARTYILMSKRADVDAKLAAVKAHAAGRPLHLRVEADPTWARFRALNKH